MDCAVSTIHSKPSVTLLSDDEDDVEIVELPSLTASNEITGDDVEIVELPVPSTSSKLSDFNLKTLLESSPDGIRIIKYHEEKKKLLPCHQKSLVRLIIDDIFIIQNRVARECIEMIAVQISMLFLSEKSVYYLK